MCVKEASAMYQYAPGLHGRVDEGLVNILPIIEFSTNLALVKSSASDLKLADQSA